MEFEIIKVVNTKGYFATQKMVEILKRDLYFPRPRKKVESIITNCIKCSLFDKKSEKSNGFLNSIPKEGGLLKV